MDILTMGRHRIHIHDRKSSHFGFTATPNLAARIRIAVHQEGISMSELVRRAVEDKLASLSIVLERQYGFVENGEYHKRKESDRCVICKKFDVGPDRCGGHQ